MIPEAAVEENVPMKISDEAAEAAWKRFYEDPDRPVSLTWDELVELLEAAAPHMLAKAWDEGHESGYAEGADVDLMVQAATNPYRPAK